MSIYDMSLNKRFKFNLESRNAKKSKLTAYWISFLNLPKVSPWTLLHIFFTFDQPCLLIFLGLVWTNGPAVRSSIYEKTKNGFQGKPWLWRLASSLTKSSNAIYLVQVRRQRDNPKWMCIFGVKWKNGSRCNCGNY